MRPATRCLFPPSVVVCQFSRVEGMKQLKLNVPSGLFSSILMAKLQLWASQYRSHHQLEHPELVAGLGCRN